MGEVVLVMYRTQYCADGYDIGSNLHAAQDADTVRFWEGDLCLLEVQRDEDGSGWVATGGDSGTWTELGELPFSTPENALRALLPGDRYALVSDK